MVRIFFAVIVGLALLSSACAGIGGEDETVSNTTPVINGTLVGSGVDARGIDFAVWKSSSTYYIKYATPKGFAVNPLFRESAQDRGTTQVEVKDCAQNPGSEILLKNITVAYSMTQPDGTKKDVSLKSTVVLHDIDAPGVGEGQGYQDVRVPQGYETDPSVTDYASCTGASSGTELLPQVPVQPQASPAN